MLLSDSGSNVLLYLSGHGGDGFLKFRDVSNVQSHDLSDALETMRTQQRFKEMLVLVDTCQAATIPEPFHTPRVTSISSSLRGENSYASAYDDFIGQALLDRFTYSTLRFIKLKGHTATVSQLVAALAPDMRSDRYNPQTLDVRATQVRQLLPPPPPRARPLPSNAAAGRNPPAQHEDQRLLLR
jgi:GPI-anchor transamidase subunit K